MNLRLEESRIMTKNSSLSSGTIHEVPTDLRKVLVSDPAILTAWEDLTPLARNEWICWNVSVKQSETRKNHIQRTAIELKEGKRRPCCWMGCVHRTDKPANPSQKYVLSKRK